MEAVGGLRGMIVPEDADINSGGGEQGTNVQMYSYNGIVLPALPEWDKTAYPYALISDRHTLYLFDRVEYGYTNIGAWSFSLSNGYDTSTYDHELAEWGAVIKRNFKLVTVYGNSFKWANFDVLNEDGSVYIAASDPVPVYE
jgi:hypothetical protein